MKYADVTNPCSEMFRVTGQFRKSFVGGMIHGIIQELFVSIHQRIQLTWNRENRMKVWSIKNILPAQVYPSIDVHSLAHGTVTVLAGIIVYKCRVARFALTHMSTHLGSPAVSDTTDSIKLFV